MKMDKHRECEHCGKVLRRLNKNTYCGPCGEAAMDAVEADIAEKAARHAAKYKCVVCAVPLTPATARKCVACHWASYNPTENDMWEKPQSYKQGSMRFFSSV